MGDLPVFDFYISSHKHTYEVMFSNNFNDYSSLGTHFIVDRNVLQHLPENFSPTVIIDATEENKTYQAIAPVIESLASAGMRRNSKLVAIGGGITQDITCWISTTYMRGIPWSFVPTTLLAQADSCIGSKSSINFGKYKNLMGSFNPPTKIIIDEKFLSTLNKSDIKSGLGEVIKLLIVANHSKKDVTKLLEESSLSKLVFEALMIKKEYIEEDEFDKGIRNILNYGHCFGHAIESATSFAIPHGIAVMMGIDLANNLSSQSVFNEYHQILFDLYKDYNCISVTIDDIINAMMHDKKNTSNKLTIIVPDKKSFQKLEFEVDYIRSYLKESLKILET